MNLKPDKRDYSRVHMDQKVFFDPPFEIAFGQTFNISHKGMALAGRYPARIGEPVKFRMFLDDLNQWIEGAGIVVWQRPKGQGHFPVGTGIEFIFLKPGHRRALNQYVALKQSFGVIDKIERRHIKKRTGEIRAEKLSSNKK